MYAACTNNLRECKTEFWVFKDLSHWENNSRDDSVFDDFMTFLYSIIIRL